MAYHYNQHLYNFLRQKIITIFFSSIGFYCLNLMDTKCNQIFLNAFMLVVFYIHEEI